MRALSAALLITALSAGVASAQTAPAAPSAPERIPSSGGEVIIPNSQSRWAYDNIQYAPARRVGDMLYVSGVIAGKAPGEHASDIEAYKAGLRQAFRHLEKVLKASGASFDDVVMINSFHVWQSPHFKGTRDEHIAAVIAVKAEFMKAPHPAWTAVGTTGLLAETGLVEIQLIARIPGK